MTTDIRRRRRTFRRRAPPRASLVDGHHRTSAGHHDEVFNVAGAGIWFDVLDRTTRRTVDVDERGAVYQFNGSHEERAPG